MRLLAIDPSLSSCAVIVMEKEELLYREVINTSRVEAKPNSPENLKVFARPTEQIKYIADRVLEISKSFSVKKIGIESPSLHSEGNATRDLAGLFHGIMLTFMNNGFSIGDIFEVSPLSIKAFAWNFLPEDKKYDGKKKDGSPKKAKLGKDEMILACESVAPEAIEGFNKTGKRGGKDDLADAYWIGRYLYDKLK